MDPKSGDAGLRIVEVLVGPQHALEHLGEGCGQWDGGREEGPSRSYRGSGIPGWGDLGCVGCSGAYFEEGRIPPRRLCLAQGQGQMEFHLGDVSKVEEVVDLGWCGQEALHHCIVHVQGGLSHHVPNGFHLFLKVLELLVDHGAKYPDDLGLLETGPQTQSQSSWPFSQGRDSGQWSKALGSRVGWGVGRKKKNPQKSREIML